MFLNLRASQVVLLIRIYLPTQEMQETWVRSLGREISGVGNGNPLQYFCLENPHGQRIVTHYSPRCCTESYMTEHTCRIWIVSPFFFNLWLKCGYPIDWAPFNEKMFYSHCSGVPILSQIKCLSVFVCMQVCIFLVFFLFHWLT